MPETYSAPAPAKVNLSLEVLARRADGYHEIVTVLQALALADRVSITFGERHGITASGPFAAGTPCDQSNLAWRAAEALAASLGRSTGALAIHLQKEIPPAGGLGGGASDAATTLRLLQRAWPEATEAQLLAAATTVGSDEAFFLVGGTALAEGRGERVRALPALPELGVVLFIPPGTIERKTPRMFAALSVLPFDSGSVSGRFVSEPPTRVQSQDVYNSFERVAFDLFPDLAGLWEELEVRTRQPVRLAGAGPTLFWIGLPHEAPHIAAAAAGAACTIIETSTAESLWRP